MANWPSCVASWWGEQGMFYASRAPWGGWTPVAYSSNYLDRLSSVPFLNSLIFSTSASWDRFPNKLLTRKSFSHSLFWGKAKRRHFSDSPIHSVVLICLKVPITLSALNSLRSRTLYHSFLYPQIITQCQAHNMPSVHAYQLREDIWKPYQWLCRL